MASRRGALDSRTTRLPSSRSRLMQSRAPGYGAAPSITTPQMSRMKASKRGASGANRASISIGADMAGEHMAESRAPRKPPPPC